MNRADSITSGQFAGIATPAQIEVAQKLGVIGWQWNRETVQKGTVRLHNDVESEFLPGRQKLASILIAEIEPDGSVKMGDTCDGFSAKAAAEKRRAARMKAAA